MKKDWEIKKLGEVCETGAGGTPLKSHRNYYEGGTIPWLLSGEVSQGEIFKAAHFITEKGFNNSSAKLFPPNTVLVAMYGATAGQVGILRFEACTNQAVCGILPNKKMVPEYIYYYFLFKKAELISQAVGGAQPNISQFKIKETKIPIPLLQEQQHIVSIIDEAFAAIDQAKSLLQRNLQNAKELFQSELNSVFSNKGEGWEEKTLDEVCQIVGGGTPSKSNYDFYKGTILWATVRDMKADMLTETEFKISEDAVKKSSTKIIPKGNVIIATRVGLGKVCLITKDTAINQDLRGIIPIQESISALYLFWWLKSISQKIIDEGTGATVQGVKLPFIKSLKIPFPKSKERQTQIVHQLDTLKAATQKLEATYQQKLNSLEELKKSILDKAFNGELSTGMINPMETINNISSTKTDKKIIPKSKGKTIA